MLRVAILGCPAQPTLAWDTENLTALRRLGFNTIQLNIAWGSRPADEPLNLEDVVLLSETDAAAFPQPVPLRCDPSPIRFQQRQADLRQRLAQARREGLRTLFHFGAPFNAHQAYGDNPPNCLMDPGVVRRHELLLERLAAEFPGIDDLLVYTYDQDAWLCSEFGTCPSCRGVPLDRRVSAFVNALAKTWRRLSPQGRLWWEPWELSAGQVFKATESLDAATVGLSLHSNVAEVMTTMPVDRWLELTVRLARERGIPVIVEHFLGSATEEMEPFLHLSCPLVTLRALRRINALAPDGIKEYYGLLPSGSDVILHTTGLFFERPQITDDEALRELSRPYESCAEQMIAFWRTQSWATDLFPWYASWWARGVGRCEPVHSMRAAFLRGQQAHTPSWESTRRAIFMKTDDATPDPWMLEDVQLQCELAAEAMGQALAMGESILSAVPKGLREGLAANLRDLAAWKRNTLSYAFHLRETNLTRLVREDFAAGRTPPDRIVQELRAVLEADLANQGQAEPCGAALALLAKNPELFTQTYFSETNDGPEKRTFTGENERFSVTSR